MSSFSTISKFVKSKILQNVPLGSGAINTVNNYFQGLGAHIEKGVAVVKYLLQLWILLFHISPY